MSRIFFKKQGQKPSIFVTLGLVAAALSFVGLVLAGPAFKYGLFGRVYETPELFELQFRLIGASMRLVLVSAILTLIGVIHGRLSSRARTSWRAFISTLIIAAVGGVLWQIHAAVRNAPLLHDISTNPGQLLAFTTLPERTYAPTPEAIVGGRLDENYLTRLRTYYPDMIPLQFATDPNTAYARTLEAATRLGWNIVRTSPANGEIEAIYQTPWFGFTSFVILGVRAKDAGAVLDIRAISAMGHTDMGINAALIRKLKKGLARSGIDRG